MRQYDVTDPRKPKLAGSVHTGGIVRRTPHPNGKTFGGGPQMVEISRDGKRVYWTNSLYSTWDDQFYPDGVPGAGVMAHGRAERRPGTGKGLLGRVPGGLPRAPDAAGGRGLLDRLVLLPLGLNASGVGWAPAALWLAIIVSGLFHGVNPGMGWPLAVSAGLMQRRPRAVLEAFGPLSAGHLLAMLLMILPFSLLVTLVAWQGQIQVGASLLVLAFGLFRLVWRRHPRGLARIRPTQLGLWSFAVAMAHGAGLMLVPIYLGLCRTADVDAAHAAAGNLMGADLGMAVLVSLVHTVAMIMAGGTWPGLRYRVLGLQFVSRSWFNLDAAWAGSLVLVGAISLGFAVRALA